MAFACATASFSPVSPIWHEPQRSVNLPVSVNWRAAWHAAVSLAAASAIARPCGHLSAMKQRHTVRGLCAARVASLACFGIVCRAAAALAQALVQTTHYLQSVLCTPTRTHTHLRRLRVENGHIQLLRRALKGC